LICKKHRKAGQSFVRGHRFAGGKERLVEVGSFYSKFNKIRIGSGRPGDRF